MARPPLTGENPPLREGYDGHSEYSLPITYSNGSMTINGQVKEDVHVHDEVDSAGTVGIDLANGNTQVIPIDLSGAATVTIGSPSGFPDDGETQTVTLYIINKSAPAGNLTLAFHADYLWSSGVSAPAGTSNTGDVIIVDATAITLDGSERVLARTITYENLP